MKLKEKEKKKRTRKKIDIAKAEEGLNKAKKKILDGALLSDRRTYPG